MATHFGILAWRIPWTEEPGRLYSPWGCKESDMTEQLSLTDAFNEIPTPYLCPSCLRPPQLRPPAKASGSSAAPF